MFFLSDGQKLKIEKSILSEYALIDGSEQEKKTLFRFLHEFLHYDSKTKGQKKGTNCLCLTPIG